MPIHPVKPCKTGRVDLGNSPWDVPCGFLNRLDFLERWFSHFKIIDGEAGMTKGKQPKDIFDVQRIREIIELMEEHDLSAVDLQQGDEKIKLNRGGSVPVYAAPTPAPAAAAPAVSAPAAADPASNAGSVTINAPMVGTFYARANPESDPFVKVGDVVSEDTIVCIVEAMKVFNEIPAECSGKIVEILVKDQEAIDFGKPMFRVEPS